MEYNSLFAIFALNNEHGGTQAVKLFYTLFSLLFYLMFKGEVLICGNFVEKEYKENLPATQCKCICCLDLVIY